MSEGEDTGDALSRRISELERQVGALQAENAVLKECLGEVNSECLATNQLVFEQISISLGAFRADGLIVCANLGAGAMFGVSRHLLIDRHNVLTNDPSAAEAGTPGIFEEVLRGETVTRSPYTYDVTRGVSGAEGKGRVTWYETLYFPIRQPDGAVSHIGSMTHDTTAQVEQKQELEASRREIVAAERELAAQRETIMAL